MTWRTEECQREVVSKTTTSAGPWPSELSVTSFAEGRISINISRPISRRRQARRRTRAGSGASWRACCARTSIVLTTRWRRTARRCWRIPPTGRRATPRRSCCGGSGAGVSWPRSSGSRRTRPTTRCARSRTCWRRRRSTRRSWPTSTTPSRPTSRCWPSIPTRRAASRRGHSNACTSSRPAGPTWRACWNGARCSRRPRRRWCCGGGARRSSRSRWAI